MINYKRDLMAWLRDLRTDWSFSNSRSFGRGSGNYEAGFNSINGYAGFRFKETYFKTTLLLAVTVIRRKLNGYRL